MRSPTEENGAIHAQHLILAGCLAFGSLGLLIGRLTLRLNPELSPDTWDAALLTLYFLVGYGLVGLAAGAIAALACAILERVPVIQRADRIMRLLVIGALAGLPLSYYLALPDVGIVGDALMRMLTELSARNLLLLGTTALLCSALAGAIVQFLRRMIRLPAFSSRPAVLAILVLLAFGITLFAGIRSGRPENREVPAGLVSQPAQPAFDPAPVVLLCIDGLDPKLVGQLVDAGLLPTFERLERLGAWGSWNRCCQQPPRESGRASSPASTFAAMGSSSSCSMNSPEFERRSRFSRAQH